MNIASSLLEEQKPEKLSFYRSSSVQDFSKSFRKLNELEKITDSYSVSETEEEQTKTSVIETLTQKPELKSFVIETFEKRIDFYDEDISPILGYLLVTFSAIFLMVGTSCFLGNILGETGIYYIDVVSQTQKLFTFLPIIMVMNPVLRYLNWLSDKFVKHT